jgi:hypothetical protein
VAPRPAIVGAVGGAIIVLIDFFFFSERTKEALSRAGLNLADVAPSWWKGLLASFYGGFDEEVLTRLGLLTLFAWLPWGLPWLLAWIGAKLTRTRFTLFAWIGARLARIQPRLPGTRTIWVANVLAAVLFALGHLPTAKAIGLPIDVITVTQVLLLNGILGIAFGWFYVTAGIEAAIISHFSADIVLHVIAPLL